MLRRKIGGKRGPVRRLQHLFHGIAIEAGNSGCQAAQQLSGQRFLSDEAPRLPLEGCKQPDLCRCVYRHYSDRRTDARREADLGLPPRDIPKNQREGPGRRVTDG